MGKARRIVVLAAFVLFLSVLLIWVTRWDTTQTVKREVFYWYYNLRHPPISVQTLGNGKKRGEILLGDPAGLAEDAAGNIYLADRGRGGTGRVIWKLDVAGRAWIIAGTGRRGGAPTGIPAVQSDLGSPEGLCLDVKGRIYFADSFSHMVLRQETDGRLTRIAGTGLPGYDDGALPAKESRLHSPYDVSCGPGGTVYIADFGNHRIRKVTPEGILVTVAGTGVPGYAGDGGPATAAQLNGPYGVLLDKFGRLYVADSLNHVVRVVDPDGWIRTLAGTGVRGYRGNGGSARQAVLDTPQALGLDTEGRLLIGDEHNHVIRVVRHDGTIFTLLGTAGPGLAADGTRADQAPLNDPEDFVMRPDGSLLVADGDNRRLLALRADGYVSNFAGVGLSADVSQ
jgi:sugar lactone lactonase YvrE